MPISNSKITIHMVSSLDGYVAKPDGDVSWLEISSDYKKGKQLTVKDISEYLDKIDCYVMGANTYELALDIGWPYGDKPVYVMTKRQLKIERPSVKLYSDKLSTLAKYLKETYNNTWVVGGPTLVSHFLQSNLADELIISIKPIILGKGIPFFKNLQNEYQLQLKDVVAYSDGVVDMHYLLMLNVKF